MWWSWWSMCDGAEGLLGLSWELQPYFLGFHYKWKCWCCFAGPVFPLGTWIHDERWFDLDLTLKAVDATKPSGLIPGEGAITANPSGAIWETSTYHTHGDKTDDYSPSFTQIYVKVVDRLSSCGSVGSDEVADYSRKTQLGFPVRVRPVFWILYNKLVCVLHPSQVLSQREQEQRAEIIFVFVNQVWMRHIPKCKIHMERILFSFVTTNLQISQQVRLCRDVTHNLD